MRTPWALITPQEGAGPFELTHLRLMAALCSLPFVPFPVLRAVRQFVCPEVSEQSFCNSHLVDGASVDGISFDPTLSEQLRADVRILYGNARNTDDQASVDTLRNLLDVHGQNLSPLLAIEERLLWAWLTNTDVAELRLACELHLRDVIGTAIFENRQKIYRWASAASQRLPTECFDSALGWILSQLCRSRRIPFPTIDIPANIFSEQTLINALATGLPDRLLGLYRDGEDLELGPVDARRCVGVAVVDTDPVAINVTATQQGRNAMLWLHERRAVRVPVGGEAITITDLRGRTYTLPGFVGNEAPETAEARKALERAIAHYASGEFVNFDVLRAGKTGYVVSLPDLGCTAFLAEPTKTLRPGDHGAAFVVNVIASQRRVIVKLPRRLVDEASERTLPRPATEVPRRFSVQVMKLGKHAGVRRARSVYVLIPEGNPLGSLSPDGPGHIRFPNAAFRTADGWEPKPGSSVEIVVMSETDTQLVLRLDLGPVPAPVAPIAQAVRRPKRRPSVPWPQEETLTVGQELHLRITSVVGFGAYLELPDGREGLLHVTNMFPRRRKGNVTYRPGDTATVRIAAIDAANKRIALTQDQIWVSLPLGQEMELEVMQTVTFGVFLGLPDGRLGLLHVSEMLPAPSGDDIPYRPGDRLRVRVLSDDPIRGRIGFTQRPQ